MQSVSVPSNRFSIKRIAPSKFKPAPRVINNRPVYARSLPISVSDLASMPGVYYTSKSIILFTMFYCSMNWLYYKNKGDDKN